MDRTKKRVTRAVSLLTLCFFLVSQVTYANPGAGIEIAVNPERPSFLRIDIPTELASLDGIWEAPASANSRTILHIQNAHANYSAQKKIQSLLEYLNKTYAIKTIFVEGAAEDLNPNLMKLFPEQEKNLELADLLAQQGELTGAELFLLGEETDPGLGTKRSEGEAVKAYGIEEAALYRNNYEALKKVFGSEVMVNRYLKGYESRLEALSSKIFPNDLRRILADWQKFEKGNREFMPYVRRLVIDAKDTLKLDLESLFAQVEWPQISRLLVLQGMEKELDNAKALEEKEKLLSFLKTKRVSPSLIAEVENFKEQRLSVRQGQGDAMQPRDVLEALIKEAGPKGFAFRDYPAFSLYAGFLILKSELDAKGLFAEIKMLFEKILDSLTTTPAQKTLLGLYRDEELARKLLRLELTRRDWKQALDRKTEIEMDSLISRLKDLSAAVTKELKLAPSDLEVKSLSPKFREDVLALYTSAFSFYEFARQREAVFYEKINAVMTQGSLNKAILITGGFHTDGMTDLFREHEISYGVLTPRLMEKSDDKMYRSTMLQNEEQLFSISYLELANSFNRLATLAKQGLNPGKKLSPQIREFWKKLPAGTTGAGVAEAFNLSIAAQEQSLDDETKGIYLKHSKENGKDHFQIMKMVNGQPVPMFGGKKITVAAPVAKAPTKVRAENRMTDAEIATLLDQADAAARLIKKDATEDNKAPLKEIEAIVAKLPDAATVAASGKRVISIIFKSNDTPAFNRIARQLYAGRIADLISLEVPLLNSAVEVLAFHESAVGFDLNESNHLNQVCAARIAQLAPVELEKLESAEEIAQYWGGVSQIMKSDESKEKSVKELCASRIAAKIPAFGNAAAVVTFWNDVAKTLEGTPSAKTVREICSSRIVVLARTEVPEMTVTAAVIAYRANVEAILEYSGSNEEVIKLCAEKLLEIESKGFTDMAAIKASADRVFKLVSLADLFFYARVKYLYTEKFHALAPRELASLNEPGPLLDSWTSVLGILVENGNREDYSHYQHKPIHEVIPHGYPTEDLYLKRLQEIGLGSLKTTADVNAFWVRVSNVMQFSHYARDIQALCVKRILELELKPGMDPLEIAQASERVTNVVAAELQSVEANFEASFKGRVSYELKSRQDLKSILAYDESIFKGKTIQWLTARDFGDVLSGLCRTKILGIVQGELAKLNDKAAVENYRKSVMLDLVGKDTVTNDDFSTGAFFYRQSLDLFDQRIAAIEPSAATAKKPANKRAEAREDEWVTAEPTGELPSHEDYLAAMERMGRGPETISQEQAAGTVSLDASQMAQLHHRIDGTANGSPDQGGPLVQVKGEGGELFYASTSLVNQVTGARAEARLGRVQVQTENGIVTVVVYGKNGPSWNVDDKNVLTPRELTNLLKRYEESGFSVEKGSPAWIVPAEFVEISLPADSRVAEEVGAFFQAAKLTLPLGKPMIGKGLQPLPGEKSTSARPEARVATEREIDWNDERVIFNEILKPILKAAEDKLLNHGNAGAYEEQDKAARALLNLCGISDSTINEAIKSRRGIINYEYAGLNFSGAIQNGQGYDFLVLLYERAIEWEPNGAAYTQNYWAKDAPPQAVFKAFREKLKELEAKSPKAAAQHAAVKAFVALGLDQVRTGKISEAIVPDASSWADLFGSALLGQVGAGRIAYDESNWWELDSNLTNNEEINALRAWIVQRLFESLKALPAADRQGPLSSFAKKVAGLDTKPANFYADLQESLEDAVFRDLVSPKNNPTLMLLFWSNTKENPGMQSVRDGILAGFADLMQAPGAIPESTRVLLAPLTAAASPEELQKILGIAVAVLEQGTDAMAIRTVVEVLDTLKAGGRISEVDQPLIDKAAAALVESIQSGKISAGRVLFALGQQGKIANSLANKLFSAASTRFDLVTKAALDQKSSTGDASVNVRAALQRAVDRILSDAARILDPNQNEDFRTAFGIAEALETTIPSILAIAAQVPAKAAPARGMAISSTAPQSALEQYLGSLTEAISQYFPAPVLYAPRETVKAPDFYNVNSFNEAMARVPVWALYNQLFPADVIVLGSDNWGRLWSSLHGFNGLATPAVSSFIEMGEKRRIARSVASDLKNLASTQAASGQVNSVVSGEMIALAEKIESTITNAEAREKEQAAAKLRREQADAAKREADRLEAARVAQQREAMQQREKEKLEKAVGIYTGIESRLNGKALSADKSVITNFVDLGAMVRGSKWGDVVKACNAWTSQITMLETQYSGRFANMFARKEPVLKELRTLSGEIAKLSSAASSRAESREMTDAEALRMLTDISSQTVVARAFGVDDSALQAIPAIAGPAGRLIALPTLIAMNSNDSAKAEKRAKFLADAKSLIRLVDAWIALGKIQSGEDSFVAAFNRGKIAAFSEAIGKSDGKSAAEVVAGMGMNLPAFLRASEAVIDRNSVESKAETPEAIANGLMDHLVSDEHPAIKAIFDREPQHKVLFLDDLNSVVSSQMGRTTDPMSAEQVRALVMDRFGEAEQFLDEATMYADIQGLMLELMAPGFRPEARDVTPWMAALVFMAIPVLALMMTLFDPVKDIVIGWVLPGLVISVAALWTSDYFTRRSLRRVAEKASARPTETRRFRGEARTTAGAERAEARGVLLDGILNTNSQMILQNERINGELKEALAEYVAYVLDINFETLTPDQSAALVNDRDFQRLAEGLIVALKNMRGYRGDNDRQVLNSLRALLNTLNSPTQRYPNLGPVLRNNRSGEDLQYFLSLVATGDQLPGPNVERFLRQPGNKAPTRMPLVNQGLPQRGEARVTEELAGELDAQGLSSLAVTLNRPGRPIKFSVLKDGTKIVGIAFQATLGERNIGGSLKHVVTAEYGADEKFLYVVNFSTNLFGIRKRVVTRLSMDPEALPVYETKRERNPKDWRVDNAEANVDIDDLREFDSALYQSLVDALAIPVVSPGFEAWVSRMMGSNLWRDLFVVGAVFTVAAWIVLAAGYVLAVLLFASAVLPDSLTTLYYTGIFAAVANVAAFGSQAALNWLVGEDVSAPSKLGEVLRRLQSRRVGSKAELPWNSFSKGEASETPGTIVPRTEVTRKQLELADNNWFALSVHDFFSKMFRLNRFSNRPGSDFRGKDIMALDATPETPGTIVPRTEVTQKQIELVGNNRFARSVHDFFSNMFRLNRFSNRPGSDFRGKDIMALDATQKTPGQSGAERPEAREVVTVELAKGQLMEVTVFREGNQGHAFPKGIVTLAALNDLLKDAGKLSLQIGRHAAYFDSKNILDAKALEATVMELRRFYSQELFGHEVKVSYGKGLMPVNEALGRLSPLNWAMINVRLNIAQTSQLTKAQTLWYVLTGKLPQISSVLPIRTLAPVVQAKEGNVEEDVRDASARAVEGLRNQQKQDMFVKQFLSIPVNSDNMRAVNQWVEDTVYTLAGRPFPLMMDRRGPVGSDRLGSNDLIDVFSLFGVEVSYKRHKDGGIVRLLDEDDAKLIASKLADYIESRAKTAPGQKNSPVVQDVIDASARAVRQIREPFYTKMLTDDLLSFPMPDDGDFLGAVEQMIKKFVSDLAGQNIPLVSKDSGWWTVGSMMENVKKDGVPGLVSVYSLFGHEVSYRQADGTIVKTLTREDAELIAPELANYIAVRAGLPVIPVAPRASVATPAAAPTATAVAVPAAAPVAMPAVAVKEPTFSSTAAESALVGAWHIETIKVADVTLPGVSPKQIHAKENAHATAFSNFKRLASQDWTEASLRDLYPRDAEGVGEAAFEDFKMNLLRPEARVKKSEMAVAAEAAKELARALSPDQIQTLLSTTSKDLPGILKGVDLSSMSPSMQLALGLTRGLAPLVKGLDVTASSRVLTQLATFVNESDFSKILQKAVPNSQVPMSEKPGKPARIIENGFKSSKSAEQFLRQLFVAYLANPTVDPKALALGGAVSGKELEALINSIAKEFKKPGFAAKMLKNIKVLDMTVPKAQTEREARNFLNGYVVSATEEGFRQIGFDFEGVRNNALGMLESPGLDLDVRVWSAVVRAAQSVKPKGLVNSQANMALLRQVAESEQQVGFKFEKGHFVINSITLGALKSIAALYAAFQQISKAA